MIEILGKIDADLMVFLNGFHNSYFDDVMYLTSEKWVWVPVYTAILIATIMKFGINRRMLAVVGIFTLTIVLADTTCAAYLRPIFCRPRPSQPDSGISMLIHVVNGYRGGHYGMPSCHSANSFALAALTMIIFKSRKLTTFIYTWAVIHTYSRIYLGVHYPGDILVGGLVGTAIAVAVCSRARLCMGAAAESRPSPSYVIMYTGAVVFAILLIAPAFDLRHTLIAWLG